MAVKDLTVTLKGDQTVLSAVQLFPQQDGSVTIVINGGTKDSRGQVVALGEARGSLQPSDPALAPLLTKALVALRHANELDDVASSPIPAKAVEVKP